MMTHTDNKPPQTRIVLSIICVIILSVIAWVGFDETAHAQTVGK
jgi:hypothetical protein